MPKRYVEKVGDDGLTKAAVLIRSTVRLLVVIVGLLPAKRMEGGGSVRAEAVTQAVV